MPLFRNDDVSPETDVEAFKQFCAVFHKYGYTQLHGVTIWGHTHDKVQENGISKVYPNMEPIAEMSPQRVIELSKDSYIGHNEELVEFLNAIPDPIALHGLYHYDMTRLTEDEQRESIAEGLRLLKLLFPHKKVTSFIPPFNKYNAATEHVCRKLGLTLHTDKGEHLEAMIHYANRCEVLSDKEYRYHHHRFYKDSVFSYYDLSVEAINRFLMETAPLRPLLSRDTYAQCIEESGAQVWYAYAYKNFEKLGQCYTPYRWIRDNVARHKRIVETGCGAGGVLHMLWHEGFENLNGYDLDEKAVAAGKLIDQRAGSSITFAEKDCTQALNEGTFDVILGMNWIYLLNSFGLQSFIETHISSLNTDGYLIFDTIDHSFNDHPFNMFFTQDWEKEDGERRPSEYHERFSEEEVKALLESFGMIHVDSFVIEYTIPRIVYVFQKMERGCTR